MATMKKAANGSGTICKKTIIRSGKEYSYWEARVTVGYDPGTGKQLRKTFTGKTQKEVREKMQQAQVDLNNGEYFQAAQMPLSRWIEIWLAEYCGDKKWSTRKHYAAACKTHILPALGAVKLSALSVPQIQKFYNDMQRSGLNPKTVRNIHGILSKCLSTAVSISYLKNNAAERVTLPRVIKKEIQPLTDDQVKAFLSVVDSDDFAAILKTILFTGLREAEAIGLTWDCVDFDTGALTICKQLQKRPLSEGGYVFAPLKNDKTRVIVASPFVMEILRKQQLKQMRERLAAGPIWEGWKSEKERKTSLVFTTPLGVHLTPTSVYYHFKQLAASIGCPDSRVHDLRHTFAVLSLQNGDDVKTVQTNLGHATAAFTLDVYGHCSAKMKQDSADRMQRYIVGLTG